MEVSLWTRQDIPWVNMLKRQWKARPGTASILLRPALSTGSGKVLVIIRTAVVPRDFDFFRSFYTADDPRGFFKFNRRETFKSYNTTNANVRTTKCQKNVIGTQGYCRYNWSVHWSLSCANVIILPEINSKRHSLWWHGEYFCEVKYNVIT